MKSLISNISRLSLKRSFTNLPEVSEIKKLNTLDALLGFFTSLEKQQTENISSYIEQLKIGEATDVIIACKLLQVKYQIDQLPQEEGSQVNNSLFNCFKDSNNLLPLFKKTQQADGDAKLEPSQPTIHKADLLKTILNLDIEVLQYIKASSDFFNNITFEFSSVFCGKSKKDKCDIDIYIELLWQTHLKLASCEGGFKINILQQKGGQSTTFSIIRLILELKIAKIKNLSKDASETDDITDCFKYFKICFPDKQYEQLPLLNPVFFVIQSKLENKISQHNPQKFLLLSRVDRLQLKKIWGENSINVFLQRCLREYGISDSIPLLQKFLHTAAEILAKQTSFRQNLPHSDSDVTNIRGEHSTDRKTVYNNIQYAQLIGLSLGNIFDTLHQIANLGQIFTTEFLRLLPPSFVCQIIASIEYQEYSGNLLKTILQEQFELNWSFIEAITVYFTNIPNDYPGAQNLINGRYKAFLEKLNGQASDGNGIFKQKTFVFCLCFSLLSSSNFPEKLREFTSNMLIDSIRLYPDLQAAERILTRCRDTSPSAESKAVTLSQIPNDQDEKIFPESNIYCSLCLNLPTNKKNSMDNIIFILLNTFMSSAGPKIARCHNYASHLVTARIGIAGTNPGPSAPPISIMRTAANGVSASTGENDRTPGEQNLPNAPELPINPNSQEGADDASSQPGISVNNQIFQLQQQLASAISQISYLRQERDTLNTRVSFLEKNQRAMQARITGAQKSIPPSLQSLPSFFYYPRPVYGDDAKPAQTQHQHKLKDKIRTNKNRYADGSNRMVPAYLYEESYEKPNPKKNK